MTERSGVGSTSSTSMSERMQALLSRAVEEQLSEQRQLAGLLAEIRAQLARLPGEVTQAAGVGPDPQVAALTHAVNAVSNELRAAVQGIGGRLDAVSRLVEQRGHDLADLRARLDARPDPDDRVLERLDGLERRLGELAAQAQESQRRLADHVDEAVLALAEALLRRRSGRRADEPGVGAPAVGGMAFGGSAARRPAADGAFAGEAEAAPADPDPEARAGAPGALPEPLSADSAAAVPESPPAELVGASAFTGEAPDTAYPSDLPPPAAPLGATAQPAAVAGATAEPAAVAGVPADAAGSKETAAAEEERRSRPWWRPAG